tara:strand:- start:174 stop:878 length:705 start_codon:yes stop_codon:yes gene_type:complete
MKTLKFNLSDVNGVIFDLDGVITDTASIHEIAWKNTFDNQLKNISNKKFAKDDYLNHIDGKPRLKAIYDYLNFRKIKKTKLLIEIINKEKNDLFLDLIKNKKIKIYRDSLNLLKEIKKLKIKIAVASSSKNCRFILKKARLFDMFDFIVDGSDLENKKINGKPDPAIFSIAIKKLSLDKNKTIIFEDSPSGIISAVKSGAKFVIGVARSSNSKELKKAGANIVVYSIDQIKIIK